MERDVIAMLLELDVVASILNRRRDDVGLRNALDVQPFAATESQSSEMPRRRRSG